MAKGCSNDGQYSTRRDVLCFPCCCCCYCLSEALSHIKCFDEFCIRSSCTSKLASHQFWILHPLLAPNQIQIRRAPIFHWPASSFADPKEESDSSQVWAQMTQSGSEWSLNSKFALDLLLLLLFRCYFLVSPSEMIQMRSSNFAVLSATNISHSTTQHEPALKLESLLFQFHIAKRERERSQNLPKLALQIQWCRESLQTNIMTTFVPPTSSSLPLSQPLSSRRIPSGRSGAKRVSLFGWHLHFSFHFAALFKGAAFELLLFLA